MTFTWDSTDLSTDLAKARSRLGDTDSTDPLLTDEQIEAEVALTADIWQALVNCCQTILGKLARRNDRSGARFNATRSQQFQHYKDLLAEFQSRVGSIAGPSWSEQSIADAESIEDDDDFEPPAFKVGRDDNNG